MELLSVLYWRFAGPGRRQSGVFQSANRNHCSRFVYDEPVCLYVSFGEYLYGIGDKEVLYTNDLYPFEMQDIIYWTELSHDLFVFITHIKIVCVNVELSFNSQCKVHFENSHFDANKRYKVLIYLRRVILDIFFIYYRKVFFILFNF